MNPVINLQYSQNYVYPTCCGCPGFNCFQLDWSPPTSSSTDTLIGYTIFKDNTPYLFQAGISYGTGLPTDPTTCCPDWFNGTPFWVTVKAVYNHDSVLSIADDSILVTGMAIGMEESEQGTDNISLAPNPFTDQVTLYSTVPMKNARLTLQNTTGQTLMQVDDLHGDQYTISRGDLPAGVYVMRLHNGNSLLARRLLVW